MIRTLVTQGKDVGNRGPCEFVRKRTLKEWMKAVQYVVLHTQKRKKTWAKCGALGNVRMGVLE